MAFIYAFAYKDIVLYKIYLRVGICKALANPDVETTYFPNTTLIYPHAIFFRCQHSRLEGIKYHWE